MGEHLFVSHSRADARPFVRELAALLAGGPAPVRLEHGGDYAGPDRDPDRRIRDGIRTCRAFLLVMTPDAVRDDSPCADERALAATHGRPVLALRVGPSAEVPPGIRAHQVVDFTRGPAEGAAALRRRLTELDLALPAGAPPLVPDAVIGRDVEIDELAAALRDGGVRQVALVGPPGIGKTTLACHVLAADPDLAGVVHIGPLDGLPVCYPQLFRGLCRLLPGPVAARLAGRMALAPETPTAMVRALVDAVAEAIPGGRVAVLLDDITELVTAAGSLSDPALEEALRALLSGPGHGVTVVLTTRRTPDALLAHEPARQRRLDLTGLAEPAAAELLGGVPGLPAAELSRAVQVTGGNPRALEALAAVLVADADTPPAVHLDLVEKAPGPPVETLVGAAFELLDPVPRAVVAALAVLPVPVPPAAVDAVLRPFRGSPDSTISTAAHLHELHEWRLVRGVAGRYSVDLTTREYVLEAVPDGLPADRAADPPPPTRFALRALAADLLAAAAAPYEDCASVDDLIAHLAEFLLRLDTEDVDEAARVLMRGPNALLQAWGHHDLAVALLGRVHERIGPPWLNGWCASALGGAYAALGQPRRAVELLERALMLAIRTDDRVEEAEQLGHLGHRHAELGDIPRAMKRHERALAIHRDTGNRRRSAAALRELGWCHTQLGDPHTALGLYERALAADRAAGERESEIRTLAVLGRAHADTGDLTRAAAVHEQGRVLARSTDRPRAEAAHTRGLADGRAAVGRVPEAIELYEQARTTGHALGDRHGEAAALAGLARCRLLQDRQVEAVDLAEEALGIARAAGDLRVQAGFLTDLGDCFLHLEGVTRARTCFTEAIELADVTGCGPVQALARLGLARAHLWAGDLPRAEKEALIAARHPYPPAQPGIALVAGAVELREGDLTAAERFFRTAIARADALARAPGDTAFAVLDLRALARAGLTMAGPDDAGAVEDFRAARALCSAPGVVSVVLRWMDVLAPDERHDTLDALRPPALD